MVRVDTHDTDTIEAVMTALNELDLSFDAPIEAGYMGTEWELSRPAGEIAQDIGL